MGFVYYLLVYRFRDFCLRLGLGRLLVFMFKGENDIVCSFISRCCNISRSCVGLRFLLEMVEIEVIVNLFCFRFSVRGFVGFFRF